MRSSLLFRTGALVGTLLGAAAASGCYHSIITTDLPVGQEMHHEPWKPAFVAGLVPAQVDGGAYCAGRRWAKVETQQSFLNWVVAAVTLGIFTPLDIRVYCAAPGAGAVAPAEGQTIQVGAAATAPERARAFQWAADIARRTGEPIYLAF